MGLLAALLLPWRADASESNPLVPLVTIPARVEASESRTAPEDGPASVLKPWRADLRHLAATEADLPSFTKEGVLDISDAAKLLKILAARSRPAAKQIAEEAAAARAAQCPATASRIPDAAEAAKEDIPDALTKDGERKTAACPAIPTPAAEKEAPEVAAKAPDPSRLPS